MIVDYILSNYQTNPLTFIKALNNYNNEEEDEFGSCYDNNELMSFLFKSIFDNICGTYLDVYLFDGKQEHQLVVLNYQSKFVLIQMNDGYLQILSQLSSFSDKQICELSNNLYRTNSFYITHKQQFFINKPEIIQAKYTILNLN
ncbi:Uncharacterised protein [uncultured archaeon]|nr:Uncharacterised protein [uncultured archaeon]